MSISWITPINVKAAESEVTRVKENIGALADELVNDNDFIELTTNFEQYEELKDIVEKVVSSGGSNALKEEYINAIQSIDAFENLKDEDNENDYLGTLNSILSDIESILAAADTDDTTDENDKVFYIGITDGDCMSVTTKENNNYIQIDGDGNIKLPRIGSLDPSTWENIKDFLILLFLGAVAGAGAVLVLAGVIFLIEAILTAIAGGFATLFTAVVAIAIVFAGVAGVAMVVTFIIDVIEFLTGTAESNNRSRNSKKPIAKLLNSRVRDFLNRIFELFNMRLQSILA